MEQLTKLYICGIKKLSWQISLQSFIFIDKTGIPSQSYIGCVFFWHFHQKKEMDLPSLYMKLITQLSMEADVYCRVSQMFHEISFQNVNNYAISSHICPSIEVLLLYRKWPKYDIGIFLRAGVQSYFTPTKSILELTCLECCTF